MAAARRSQVYHPLSSLSSAMGRTRNYYSPRLNPLPLVLAPGVGAALPLPLAAATFAVTPCPHP